MKPLRLFFALFFALMLVSSCRCPEPMAEKEIVEKKTTVVVRDTFFYLAPDFSTFKAIIQTKADGSLVLRDTESAPGKRINAPKVKIEGNTLTVDCTAEAQKLFHQWKEKYTSSRETKVIRVPVPIASSNWQSFQIWTGRLTLIALLILLTLAIIGFVAGRRKLV